MIPVDEMLIDLRSVLERFESDPSSESLDLVFKETMRISDYCENIYVEMDE